MQAVVLHSVGTTGVRADQSPADSVSSERVRVLDVLRGIALLGMLVMHFADKTVDVTGDAANLFHRYISLYVDGRFFAIFGILFGVSFAIQLRRADARGERFAPRFLRRLAVLAVFGVVAEVGFGYPVLLGYAMWGVPLLLVRRWPTRSLVALLVICAASTALYRVGWFAAQAAQVGEQQAQATATAQSANSRTVQQDMKRDLNSADIGRIIQARMRRLSSSYTQPLNFTQYTFLPSDTFTLFLLGLLGFRLRVFDQPATRRWAIVGLMTFGIAAWAVSEWVLPLGTPRMPQSGESATGRILLIHLAYTFFLLRTDWLAFAYIGAVLLLVSRTAAWLNAFAPFEWAGRMALTNYMLQIAVLDLVFTPHGFGLSVTPWRGPVWAVGLFLSQALFSRWWLERYQYGPLEWVWRSATYWRRPTRLVAASD